MSDPVQKIRLTNAPLFFLSFYSCLELSALSGLSELISSLNTMDPTQKSNSLDSVLVVGGAGFLRFHIVRCLLEDPDCSTVSVLSRNPDNNRLPGVFYYAGDISNPKTIQSLLDELRPHVIIHAASPGGHVTGNTAMYQETNIKGTGNLLACAAQAHSTRAFVYTSSTVVMIGSKPNFANESSPVLSATSKENEYAKTKAIADTLLLEANDTGNESGNGLRTACLRNSNHSHVWRERHTDHPQTSRDPPKRRNSGNGLFKLCFIFCRVAIAFHHRPRGPHRSKNQIK